MRTTKTNNLNKRYRNTHPLDGKKTFSFSFFFASSFYCYYCYSCSSRPVLFGRRTSERRNETLGFGVAA
jgi:hypothetical protein